MTDGTLICASMLACDVRRLQTRPQVQEHFLDVGQASRSRQQSQTRTLLVSNALK